MTLLTSRRHYRKIPCPAALNLKRYFLRPGKRRQRIRHENNIKIIGTVVCARLFRLCDSKSWRAHGIAPARRQKTHSFRLLNCSGDFVGCHQLQLIDKYQMAERLKPGGIFRFNTPYSADEVWSRSPQAVQAVLNQKKRAFYGG